MQMNSNPVQGYFARRALSGMMRPPHVGPISGPTPGRADKVPMHVAAGSYVLPADHVSALGQGNTHAGFGVLGKMFPAPGRSVRSTIPKPKMFRWHGGSVLRGYAVGGAPAPTVTPTETGTQGRIQTNPGAISGAGSLASGPLWPGFTPSATPMIKNPNAASNPGQGYIPANYANEATTAPSSLATANPSMLWNAAHSGPNSPAAQVLGKSGLPLVPPPTVPGSAPTTMGNIPLGQPGSGLGVQLANNPMLTSADQTALSGIVNAPATGPSIPGLTAPANATTSFAGGVVRAKGGRTHHTGEHVEIQAADGEYVLHPSQIIAKFGDLKRGHEELDKWVLHERKKHIHKLKKLPPPAKK